MSRKKGKKKQTIKYNKLLILFAFFCFGLIIYRLSIITMSKEIDGYDLSKLSSSRTTAKEIISSERGNIYSTNGDVLAQNVSSYKLIAYLSEKRTTNKKKPQHVVDKDLTAEKLAPILGISKEEILKYLSKENVYQVEFGKSGKNLSELTKKKIEELKLPGLDFIESLSRYYPKGTFMSYTLGYTKEKEVTDDTGNNKISQVGEMGIEKEFDKTLAGKDGYIEYQKDLKGYKIPDTTEIRHDSISGKDVYLTIDSNVQFYVEEAMRKSKETYGYEWMTMVVLDAKSGKVIGLGSNPSFDPNKRDITNYLDLTYQSPYEPGSTMKTFTYMAALENGVYNGNENYLSGVYKTADGTEIGDWKREGWGYINFDTGYALSSNVGVINLINRHMGGTMIRTYFKKLGFGTKTGIDLPNEATGRLGFKYETEIYNAGFGQGITTTPMQNAQALTPLTNDGMLLRPYIVEKIVDPSTGKTIKKYEKEEIERVASTNTVNKIKSLMDMCVNGDGYTGTYFKLENKELIGKTGTAQISDTNGRGYLAGKEQVIVSFSGIYPKSDPQIIIYASIKRPVGGFQTPLNTAVKEVVQNITTYWGEDTTKSPNEVKETIKYNVESMINKSVDNAKTYLENKNIKNIVVFGSGNKVVNQYPKINSEITDKDRIYLITDGEVVMPDFTGYSSKTAKAIAEILGLKVKLNNTGYVTKQSIDKGSKIEKDKEIVFDLSPLFNVS